jgi:hypothetical protein
MSMSLSRSPRRARLLILCLVLAALSLPSAAWAYTDNMGPTLLSPGSYIQTPGAHTFKQSVGSSVGSATALACQLRNDSGVNIVDHGNGGCWALWYGTAYVWGRVYNQGAFSDTVSGWAST